MEIFSARLKWLRNIKGFKQAEMAEKVGMSQPGYTKIENGQREPNLEVLSLLPSILEQSVDFMIGVTDFTQNTETMYEKFMDASSAVFELKLELKELLMNPNSNEIKSKDFDPNDPVSVENKINSIKKVIPLWEDRKLQAKTKLIKMLEQIPMVKEETMNIINQEDPWSKLYDMIDQDQV